MAQPFCASNHLEQKGSVVPRRETVDRKTFRYDSSKDVELIRMINAYLDEGFRYDKAIKKAGTHLESEASVNVKTDQS